MEGLAGRDQPPLGQSLLSQRLVHRPLGDHSRHQASQEIYALLAGPAGLHTPTPPATMRGIQWVRSGILPDVVSIIS